jgi:hypothetical protein
MAQSFDCLCGTPTCRGRIGGARDMTLAQLDGLWLNGHIRELLEERETGTPKEKNGTAAAVANGNGGVATKASENDQNGSIEALTESANQTVQALRDALMRAEKVVEALQLTGFGQANGSANGNGYDAVKATATKPPSGCQRRGPTSRELSGEMGGDTSVHV